MAGTVTVTEEAYGSIKKIHFAWVSDASGNVNGAGGATVGAYNGAILRLVTVPNGGGTAPTSYAVTVNDQDSTDVLMGAGTGRSATVTEQVLASSLGVVANDTLTIGITGAGNAKGGDIYLYIR